MSTRKNAEYWKARHEIVSRELAVAHDAMHELAEAAEAALVQIKQDNDERNVPNEIPGRATETALRAALAKIGGEIMNTHDKATPRPWAFEYETEAENGIGIYADEKGNGERVATVWTGEDDAVLLIRAANAHDAMRELVKAARACMVDLDHYVSTHGPGPDRRRDTLRAALAKIDETKEN